MLTDKSGGFRASVPEGPVTLKIERRDISPQEHFFRPEESLKDLNIKVAYPKETAGDQICWLRRPNLILLRQLSYNGKLDL